MDIIESILNIPVQDPPEEEFSSADLSWSKFGTADRHDNVALIPYAKVDAFIIGECSNVECPTRFHIERGRKRSKGSLKEYKSDEYLEYRLNIEVQREIFKCLGKIVYSIWDGVDYSVALEELNQDFVDQTSFVQYFNASWVPKIEMWLTSMRNLPLASQEASGAIEAYHVKLKVKLYDDSHLGALQRVDWALQIPDCDVTLDDKDHLFAKVGNLCKHVVKQILEQIQKLVELNSSNDIGCVVNNMPLKWIAKRGRTSVGKPPSALALPSSSKSNAIVPKRNMKRKRLSRLR
ncbi:hypothetical protein C3L33_04553, partial [Rhododendron williamsianum]